MNRRFVGFVAAVVVLAAVVAFGGWSDSATDRSVQKNQFFRYDVGISSNAAVTNQPSASPRIDRRVYLDEVRFTSASTGVSLTVSIPVTSLEGTNEVSLLATVITISNTGTDGRWAADQDEAPIPVEVDQSLVYTSTDGTNGVVEVFAHQ